MTFLVLFVFFFILAPLADRWIERRDEEAENVTRLADCARLRERRKRTYY